MRLRSARRMESFIQSEDREMDFYIAIAAVALPICGVVLASIVLFKAVSSLSGASDLSAASERLTRANSILRTKVLLINFAEAGRRLEAGAASTVKLVRYSSVKVPIVAAQAARKKSPADLFLEALWSCSDFGLRISPEIRKWAKELDAEAGRRGVGTSREFQMKAAEIVEALLFVADEETSRNQEMMSILANMDKMAALAGVEFIDPRKGQPVIKRQHHTVGVLTEHSHVPNTIASVKRRGLMRVDGAEIILPADVVIYGETY